MATKSEGKSEMLNFAIEALGWLYFASWSISMYPQVFLNYNRQRYILLVRLF